MARILIVEDEKDLRDLYVEILRDAGYEVDSAPEGETGFNKAQAGGWDLILLDIVLPKYDGMTVLEMLQEKPPVQPNGSIILLTALPQESLVHKGLTLGAVGYLIKSEVTPDQILENVKNFLEKN